MSPFRRLGDSLRRDWPSYVVIALALLIQLFLITRSFQFLLTNVLPDDAFYYFQIARNIVHGLGSTFDGIHPTNGYHPLWLVVLLPVFSALSAGGTYDIAPVYAALGISVLLNLGTGLVLFSLVSRLTQDRLARAFSLMLWCLNPFILFETLNGLETALSLFLLVSFFLLAHRAAASEKGREYLLAAVVGGLAVLARIDFVFFLAAFFGWMLVRYGLREGVRRAWLPAVVAGALIAPWFLFNLFEFHMLFTSASNANPLVNHMLVVQDNGSSLYQTVKAVPYMLVLFWNSMLGRTGLSWLLFLMAGSVIAFLSQGTAAFSFDRKRASVLIALFIGFALLFLANAGIRFTGRTWYFISVGVFISLAAASLSTLFAIRSVRSRCVLGIVALAVLGSFGIGWYGTLRNQMAAQEGLYAMAKWQNEHLPTATPVGVFNAGIIGYFSHARVVNLDGLVNNSAYDHLRTHTLWQYIEDEHIAYLSDYDIYLSYRYRSFFGIDNVFSHLTEVTRLSVATGAHGASDIPMYQVQPSPKAQK